MLVVRLEQVRPCATFSYLPKSTARRWGVRLLIALGAITGLAVVVRIVADPVATRYVRRMLASHGHSASQFDNVHVTFFPPVLRIERLNVVERAGVDWKTPLFYARRVSIALSWRSLCYALSATGLPTGSKRL
jgi:hypothetical protein